MPGEEWGKHVIAGMNGDARNPPEASLRAFTHPFPAPSLTNFSSSAMTQSVMVGKPDVGWVRESISGVFLGEVRVGVCVGVGGPSPSAKHSIFLKDLVT